MPATGMAIKAREEQERRADEQVGLQVALPAGAQRVGTARRGTAGARGEPASLARRPVRPVTMPARRLPPIPVSVSDRFVRGRSHLPTYSMRKRQRTTVAHSAGVELAVCLGLELCQPGGG